MRVCACVRACIRACACVHAKVLLCSITIESIFCHMAFSVSYM